MQITITYKPYTKRTIKISSRDLWSLDVNLAAIILASLKKYRKTQGKDYVGYPSAFCTQIGSDNWSKEQEKADVARWLHALDTMIYAFDSIVADRIVLASHEKEYKAEYNKLYTAHKKSKSDEFWWQTPESAAFWKKWESCRQQHEAQVKTGLQLFAEHFRSLYL